METKFNFKSQVCTDRVQSERLLALGLKPETADIVYYFSQSLAQDWTIIPLADGETARYIQGLEIPAWSLHRLIEMIPENVSDDWLGVSFDEVSYYHVTGDGMIGWEYYKVGNIYDCIIECYEWLIENGSFKKEYLEE